MKYINYREIKYKLLYEQVCVTYYKCRSEFDPKCTESLKIRKNVKVPMSLSLKITAKNFISYSHFHISLFFSLNSTFNTFCRVKDCRSIVGKLFKRFNLCIVKSAAKFRVMGG